ncbi:MAG TPA: DUF4381 domain-containing protein [Candidatus Competibacteraceae bacterium]|nr:DUF4381 domain-containing protein [Candidatus Competibacteraceae bacterium]
MAWRSIAGVPAPWLDALSPMPTANPLANLRDIHLPDAVSWWPPAPGWWLLTVLSLMIIAGLIAIWRRYRRESPRRAALTELARLRTDFLRDGDGTAVAVGVSLLLRRLALVYFHRNEVAGLVGAAWLQFLDRTGGGGFSEGPGQALTRAPYRPSEAFAVEELLKIAETWIKRAGKRGRRVTSS